MKAHRGASETPSTQIGILDPYTLRARIDPAFAFHASTDGTIWKLIRHFALPVTDKLLVGFEAQSPLGIGCTASFTQVRYDARTLSDMRSGA